MFRNSPVAVFTVDDLSDLPDEFFSGVTFLRQVTGILNINGIDVPLTFDLEVRNDGGVLNVLGRTVFTWVATSQITTVTVSTNTKVGITSDD